MTFLEAAGLSALTIIVAAIMVAGVVIGTLIMGGW